MNNRLVTFKEDRIFDIINYLVLSFILIIVVYPLVYIVSASISDSSMVASGKVWLLPVDITFEGYFRIFRDETIWTGYKNTIAYTTLGTALNVAMTILAAYPLSRKDFYGRKFFTYIMVFTMFFGGGLIPNYLLIKELNMLNTFWVMIIPTAVSVWNVVITRTYFQTNIPDELYEAAQIDGCTSGFFLVKILLPLSKPILAVIALYYAVNHWNQYFQAMIYLSDYKMYPLQIILRNILIQNEISLQMVDDLKTQLDQQKIAEILKFGVIVVGSVPILCLYPFLQKYFVKGVMIGSLKG